MTNESNQKGENRANKPSRIRPDWIGQLIGLLVFLLGIAGLMLTFKLSYDLFSVPPDQVISTKDGKGLDVAKAGASLMTVVWRVVMLFVMVVASAVVANRGIRLYLASRETPKLPEHSPTETGS
ncbi:MAG: hypothetical protein KF784_13790 [Fimbriimonadaceae bacterium]|nr:hypothetical protein [Fimbriimonadaceae bacterium]